MYKKKCLQIRKFILTMLTIVDNKQLVCTIHIDKEVSITEKNKQLKKFIKTRCFIDQKGHKVKRNRAYEISVKFQNHKIKL